MVYKKVESECGPYQASNGSLYDILEAINVMTPQGRNVGWDTFNNIEEAAAFYNLTYVGEQDSESVEADIRRILDEERNQ